MAKLPDYQPSLIPEGVYHFKITTEPEIRKTGNTTWLIFKFLIKDTEGNERKFSSVIFPGDSEYRIILLIAGGEPDEKGIPHLKNMDTNELVGVEFDAEIIHEADRKDPAQIRDRIRNILFDSEEDVPEPSGKDEEIPF